MAGAALCPSTQNYALYANLANLSVVIVVGGSCCPLSSPAPSRSPALFSASPPSDELFSAVVCGGERGEGRGRGRGREGEGRGRGREGRGGGGGETMRGINNLVLLWNVFTYSDLVSAERLFKKESLVTALAIALLKHF